MTTKLPSVYRRIAHFAPYRFNNSFGGIRRAKRLRYKQIDQDINLTADLVLVVGHWPKFYKDGFKFKVVAKGAPGARKVRGKNEWIAPHKYPKNMTYSQLTWHHVSQLRTAGGRRVSTITDHMRWCVQHQMRMMAEVKGDRRFALPIVAERMGAAHQRTGCQVIVMTLQNLGDPHARLCNFKAHGFSTVLLTRGRGGIPKSWAPCITWVRGTIRWR